MCPFCEKKKEEKIFEDELVFAVFDGYPVSRGHILICTSRHVPTYFDTTREEKLAIIDTIEKAKILLDEKYSPDGYNIGVNCGAAAGQSIHHLHVHVIPRYAGDMENPKGGVRGVIPAKQSY